MRDVVRRPWTLVLALLVSFASVVSAGGGDPDDRWPPGAVSSTTPGTAANSPGASPDGKWNVDDPPGEHHDVKLDTHTGTWMSVDVRLLPTLPPPTIRMYTARRPGREWRRWPV